MTERWFSKVRIRRDAPVATLASLLLPDREDDRVASGHRLMWSLFADKGSAATRDFLWRDDGQGSFLILSTTPPPDVHPLFEVHEPKRFEPNLRVGDRLRFSLRANPTVSRPADGLRTAHRNPALPPSRKTRHHDVVMDALHRLPPGARGPARDRAVATAGRNWLEAQGTRCGFILGVSGDAASDPGLRVDGYRVLHPPRSARTHEMRIAVLEFDGFLEVTDPDLFIPALGRGFGRAKAFGCGLMLIARV